ncbi:hypothetical protein, partial [uncultured Flavobacterium sp.]|uniref:hypothetical protein n=1 Tax=uncultured Flavobacterium sp. TaxID=165435 RepID=UPI0025943EBC
MEYIRFQLNVVNYKNFQKMNTLKILKYFLIIIAGSFLISCSKDDNPIIENELNGLKLVTTLSNT